MIRKHVDLIAITLLLGAIGICCHARSAVLLGVSSSRGVWFVPHNHNSRVVFPEIPRIPFTRD